MILAQALGEYGLVVGLVEGLSLLRIRVEDALRQADPVDYTVAVIVVVSLWLFLGRR
jgi:hypothetical protein